MRMMNWAALSIAAGMSSCSLAVVATPVAQMAPQPIAKAIAAASVQAPPTRAIAG